MARFMETAAHFRHSAERVFLRLRSDPLHKTNSIMPAGVPCAGAHVHETMGAESAQIIVDEDWPDFRCAASHPVQERLIDHSPKIAFSRDVAKPAAIVAIAASSDQRREITVFGALMNFPHE